MYFGNRNWRPFLTDTMRQMRDDGVRRALALVHIGVQLLLRVPAVPRGSRTTPAGSGPDAPEVLQAPDVLQPAGVRRGERRARAHALAAAPASADAHDRVHRALRSRSRWRRTAPTKRSSPRPRGWSPAAVGVDDWSVVYQSRSGPPQVPWLEPDICDHLAAVAGAASATSSSRLSASSRIISRCCTTSMSRHGRQPTRSA